MSLSTMKKIAVVGTGGSAQKFLDSTEFEGQIDFFNSSGEGRFNNQPIHNLTSLNIDDYDTVVLAIYRYEEVIHLLDRIEQVPLYWFNGVDGSITLLKDIYNDKESFFITNKQRLTVVYDLRISPPTYDILTFLVKCKLVANEKNLSALNVIVCPGDKGGFRDNIDFFSLDEMNHRLTNLLIPLIKLIDPAASLHLCSDRRQARNIFQASQHRFPTDHNFSQPIGRHHFYELFPYIDSKTDHQLVCSSEFYKSKVFKWFDDNNINHQKSITITLRESTAHIERNSNLAVWRDVSEKLNVLGYSVVIVRDTETALEPLGWGNVTEFPEASLNVFLRTALYQTSWLNLAVSNGAGVLCFLSKGCNYIYFGMYQEACTATTYEHLEKIGIVKDKNQIKGAQGDQYLSWLDVTSENVLSEVHKYFGVNFK
ncbi:hypothetical protein [Aliiglaciecola sp. NS0011-25]|uniref:hypothetical protein n=1 Tax=Aliiglaciecola sp. NS0011-25 TaxID=3127654 RepID=UPI0031074FC4